MQQHVYGYTCTCKRTGQMLKPCRREHMLNALVSQNRPVLSLIHFGTVPSPRLSLSSALLGLLTLAQGSLWHLDSATTLWQHSGSAGTAQPYLNFPRGSFARQRAWQFYFSYFLLQYKYLGNYFQDCDIYVGEDNVDIFIEQWSKKHKIRVFVVMATF